mgnify:CR=1 FL=1
MVILANFDVAAQNITPNFPYPGIWYDLMDETGSTSINVSNTSTTINLAAGAFKIYGNKASTLSVTDIEKKLFAIYPNPTNTSFKLNNIVNDLKIYDMTGKMVKSFNGNFQKGFSFNVSNLTQGIYIIKIKNELGQSLNSKLIKL